MIINIKLNKYLILMTDHFQLICLMAYQPLIGYLILKFDANNLHTVMWFQVSIPNK